MIPIRWIQWIVLGAILWTACKKNTANPAVQNPSTEYTCFGNKILKQGSPIQLFGINAFHSYGAGGLDTKSWNLDIVREFIGNMHQNPITGQPIQDSLGSYLYSLQTLADSNRAHGQISILCPFGWNGASNSVFSGAFPRTSSWWTDYKIQITAWAKQFKDQPDVWIEVWNEPYRYDRTDGYSDAIWIEDMNTMVGLIRNAGNNNMILVPCAGQGQDESVLNNTGNLFLEGKNNILFDIHAYEQWLLVSNSSFGNRLSLLQENKLPVFFGETAPINAGTLMNPGPFLDSVYQKGISISAWAWKYSNTDPDALLTAAGLPNNSGNNSWGNTFYNLSTRRRNP
jgi:mannan endo-1,4-beta-mannosidase